MTMMDRRTWIACCAALLVPAAAWAADAAAPARLSAEQIVERNVAARGGLAAWRSVGAMTTTGQLDAGGKQDVKLPFVMHQQRPNKSRLEIRFQGQTAVQVYDGMRGWKVRPFLNRNEVEAYSAAELKSAAAADELDGALVDHARKGTRVELAGTDRVAGQPAYKLKLTFKDATTRHVWVDARTFLEVKLDGEPRKLDGRVHKVSVYPRDYKTVGGVTLAHTLETVVEGVKQKQNHKITIDTVVLNPKLDAALFAKPQLPAAVPAQGL